MTASPATVAGPSVPVNAGLGLRAQHYEAVVDRRPRVGWFEVHTENYFCGGGRPWHYLERVRRDYPVSLHGVGLSLGSTDELDQAHLAKIKAVIARVEPGLVSEHLSWSSVGGRHLNELLPLPYTEESLHHVAERVTRAQACLGRRILLENVSSYLGFEHSTISEWEFLAEVARRSGCGILLDVNNVYVTCTNHGLDPRRYLDAVPADLVEEIHLAGFTPARAGRAEILIDTHARPVSDAVWSLYGHALRRLGPRPTLIEWDSEIPPLEALLAEAARAEAILEEARGVAA